MIAIVHSIYSQSVHAPASHAGLMDNEAERYCSIFCLIYYRVVVKINLYQCQCQCHLILYGLAGAVYHH